MFEFWKKRRAEKLERERREAELTARRAASIAKVKEFGHLVDEYDMAFGCHLCGERVYMVYTMTTVESHAGEVFSKFGSKIGYLCARCSTVSPHSDASGGIAVANWDGKKLPWR